MSTARPYLPHYTLEDYRLWEGDWELWNGIAVSMTPSPFGPHGFLTGTTATVLNNAITSAGCDAVVLVEVDWIISDDTVVRPDLSVICGSAPERHIEERPAIVVEILSDSTRERDTQFKRELYEQQRVRHYLILDPVAASLAAFTLDDAGRYREQQPSETLTLDICGACSIEINIPQLFR